MQIFLEESLPPKSPILRTPTWASPATFSLLLMLLLVLLLEVLLALPLRLVKPLAKLFWLVPLLPLLLVDLLHSAQSLFQLHPTILEPYLDLALCQAEGVCDLYAPPASQIVVAVELLL